MDNGIFGIILKVSYDSTGDTSRIGILGKTMLEWVTLALDKSPYIAVDYNSSLGVAEQIIPHISPNSEYCVVLYSDTPLITKKTVSDAVAEAKASNRAVVKMTRGYVLKTEYILKSRTIYTSDTTYFDEEDFITAFNFKQVAVVSDILKTRIINFHTERGVQFEDPSSTFVGCDVTFGKNVVVGPSNIIKGKTAVKDGAILKSGNEIDGCVIDEGAEISRSVLNGSYIGKKVTVGPYANIRKDNIIGDGCKIGDFVELKNCRIDSDCKISHLTYAGDVVMGKECNIGAGVVFANYNGKDKYTAIVGERVFVGSSATIVAPVNIGDGAFIAAGSVITEDVPSKALGIGRARQTVKEGWDKNKYTEHLEEKDR